MRRSSYRRRRGCDAAAAYRPGVPPPGGSIHNRGRPYARVALCGGASIVRMASRRSRQGRPPIRWPDMRACMMLGVRTTSSVAAEGSETPIGHVGRAQRRQGAPDEHARWAPRPRTWRLWRARCERTRAPGIKPMSLAIARDAKLLRRNSSTWTYSVLWRGVGFALVCSKLAEGIDNALAYGHGCQRDEQVDHRRQQAG